MWGLMEAGLQDSTWPRSSTLGAAPQQTHVVASFDLVQQLAEHFHAGNGGLLTVSLIPTISISSPTLTIPRSIRPVTTVPRPRWRTRLPGHHEGAVNSTPGVGM